MNNLQAVDSIIERLHRQLAIADAIVDAYDAGYVTDGLWEKIEAYKQVRQKEAPHVR